MDKSKQHSTQLCPTQPINHQQKKPVTRETSKINQFAPFLVSVCIGCRHQPSTSYTWNFKNQKPTKSPLFSPINHQPSTSDTWNFQNQKPTKSPLFSPCFVCCCHQPTTSYTWNFQNQKPTKSPPFFHHAPSAPNTQQQQLHRQPHDHTTFRPLPQNQQKIT
jgi:hypothetical protein